VRTNPISVDIRGTSFQVLKSFVPSMFTASVIASFFFLVSKA
jgi:hypothetical protein